MNRITRRSIALAATLVMMISSLAMSAPKSERGKTYFTVIGRVLKIDARQRTLLVAENKSDKLYVATMPEESRVKILWGTYAGMTSPGFENIRRHDLIRMRCVRTDEDRLARIDDEHQAFAVTAVN